MNGDELLREKVKKQVWCENHDHYKRSCPYCEAEQLREENERLKKALETAKEELRWGDAENAIERVKKIIDKSLRGEGHE